MQDTRYILVLLLAVTALIAAPAAAQAGWKVDRATAIARTVWHHPCVDEMQVTWGTLESSDEIGEAIYPCVVLLADDAPLTWEEFCTTVLHEAGHLAGMGHADHGIMQASGNTVVTRVRNARTGKVKTFVSGADSRCRDRGRPYLERHNAL